MNARLSRLAAVATIVGFPSAVLVGLLLARSAGGAVYEELSDGVALSVPFGAFGLVGALILLRRPGHVVGWICTGMAMLFAVTVGAISYAGWGLAAPVAVPGTVVAVWIGNWTWYPILGAATVALPLLIPDGRLPSPRWRWVAALGAASVAGMVLLAMLHPRLSTFEDQGTMPNPIGVAGVPAAIDSAPSNVLLAGMVVAFVGAVASIVVRYRRAGREDRLRLKWIVFAFALTLVTGLTLDVVQHLGLREGIGNTVWAAVWMILPVCIGIAVLRHRLFDIDRIISRTVSYALLTAVLAGVYVAGVVGLGAVVRASTGGGGGDLVVAGSTLAVAALFGPMRHRLQTMVDRRFNRTRYDAREAVERFAQRTRDEVDLAALDRDLRALVSSSLQPAGVSLWITKPGGGGA